MGDPNEHIDDALRRRRYADSDVVVHALAEVHAILTEHIPAGRLLIVEDTPQGATDLDFGKLRVCCVLDADNEVIWRPYEYMAECDDERLEELIGYLDGVNEDTWRPLLEEYVLNKPGPWGTRSLMIGMLADVETPELD